MVLTKEELKIQSKADSGKWLGREEFLIPHRLRGLTGSTGYLDLLGFPELAGLASPSLQELGVGKVINDVQYYPELTNKAYLHFLQMSNSGNLGYNSKTYNTIGKLASAVTRWLGSMNVGVSELSLYSRSARVFNGVFGLPSMESGAIAGFATPGAIIPVSLPQLTQITELVKSLASFMNSVMGVSAEIANLVKVAVTSIVHRVLDASGSMAFRYEIAQAAKVLVPAVSGVVNTAWNLLMAYAPYIIGGAVIILVAVKTLEKKVKQGNGLFMFEPIGEGRALTHVGYRGTIDTENDIETELAEVFEYHKGSPGAGFGTIYAFLTTSSGGKKSAEAAWVKGKDVDVWAEVPDGEVKALWEEMSGKYFRKFPRRKPRTGTVEEFEAGIDMSYFPDMV